jgi:hypothetical protein
MAVLLAIDLRYGKDESMEETIPDWISREALAA